jgi:hypothetical protein
MAEFAQKQQKPTKRGPALFQRVLFGKIDQNTDALSKKLPKSTKTPIIVKKNGKSKKIIKLVEKRDKKRIRI